MAVDFGQTHPNSASKKKKNNYYHQTSNISPTLLGNKVIDRSDVVGASPVGTAPTSSSFSA